MISRCEGVMRDDIGRWICGFGKFLGYCNSILAELYGCFYGLDLAWSKGFRRVWLEIDSKVVIDLITKGVDEKHACAGLVDLIKG